MLKTRFVIEVSTIRRNYPAEGLRCTKVDRAPAEVEGAYPTEEQIEAEMRKAAEKYNVPIADVTAQVYKKYVLDNE